MFVNVSVSCGTELDLLRMPRLPKDRAVTRRGWALFASMAVIWGVPYFLIRVAVKQFEPSVVVFGRTSLSAVALVWLAARAGAIRPALRRWRPVLAFAAIEMAIPWILLTTAEQHLASGLTALIIAAVPIVGTIAAFLLGDRSALRFVRIVGIALGLGGVALLVGRDLGSDHAPPWLSVVEVLIVCVCYATAPFIANRRLGDVPSLGVIAVSLSIVAVVYAPIAAASLPTSMPRVNAILALVALAAVCTALAFVVFFALISEAGPARAGLITFANPVVAVALGAVFLDEVVTWATMTGFALVLAGCWFATRTPPATLERPDEGRLRARAAATDELTLWSER
jgi:drug/metabolite transporter (DMT)-like permease